MKNTKDNRGAEKEERKMKNMDKKMFVVFGSEDGTIGVYSNMKLAYQKSLSYLLQNADVDDIHIDDKKLSYQNAVKQLSKYGLVEIVTRDRTQATITRFWLND